MGYAGLVKTNRHKYTAADPPDYEDIFDNVATLYAELRVIGPTLRKLRIYDAFPNSPTIPSNAANIASVNGDLIEIGVFKRFDEGTDSTVHFMLVNRICNDEYGNVTDPQTVTVGFNYPSGKKITEIASGKVWIISPNGSFSDNLNPGSGKLYKISPTTYDWTGNITMTSTFTVPSGNTLTIASGSSLSFAENSSLLVNGQLNAQGNSGQHITFTWPSDNNGAIVFSGSNGSAMSYCDITYAQSPIVAKNGTTNLSVSHCKISNSFFWGVDPDYAQAAIAFYSSNGTVSNSEIAGIAGATNGIRFSNSNATLSGSRIHHLGGGSGIVIQGGSSPTISGNTIDSNYYNGIYELYNDPGCPVISSNYLYYNGMPGGQYYCNGISITASTALVQNNIIQKSNWGIASQNFSSVYAYDRNQYPFWTTGNNSVTQCNYGIFAYSGSNMDMGYFDTWDYLLGGSCNSFFSDNLKAAAAADSWIGAEANWWGSPYVADSTYADGSSSIDTWLPLGSQYSCWDFDYGRMQEQILASKSTAVSNSPSSGAATKEVSDDLAKARMDRRKGKYDEAMGEYKNAIANGTSNRKPQILAEYFTMLRDRKSQLCVQELESYLSDQTDLGSTASRLLPYAHLAAGNYADAARLATRMKSTVSDKETQKNYLVLLASLKNFHPDYGQTSLSAIEELKGSYTDVLEPGLLAAMDTKNLGMKLSQKAQTDSSQSASVEGSALASYPNPFNPSTRIQFTVKRPGLVSLKVYDMLGREVVTLVNEVKNPGKYEAVWNASQLASGIYFARFESSGKIAIHKILFLK